MPRAYIGVLALSDLDLQSQRLLRLNVAALLVMRRQGDLLANG
jgi:hypothetical protein